jgi:hypothetical protein
MADEAKVKIKLVIDDTAAKMADNIKGKFGRLKSAVRGVNSALVQMGKDAVATAIGMNIMPGIQNLIGGFKEVINNAVQVQGHMRAVGSYFVAGADMAWDAAMKRSREIDAQLYKSAINIGQSIDDARAAFTSLAMQSDGSAAGIAKAADEAERLMMFADVANIDVKQMANEWGMMSRGVIRSQSAITKIMFSTGIFGDNLKTASTYWGNLTDEERQQRLKGALDKIVDRFGSAPQTMGSVIAGFDNIKSRLVDIMGMNIIGVLTSRYDTVLKAIEAKRPQLEALAARFGTFMAGYLDKALLKAGEYLTYIEKNFDTIVKDMEDGAKAILKVVKFIVANRDLIIAAYGLNMMAPSIQVAMQATPVLKAMMMQLKLISFSSLPGFGKSLKATALSAWSANKGLISLAAAVGAAYLAFDQYKKLQTEGGFGEAYKQFRYGEGQYYGKADIAATKESLAKALKEGNVQHIERLVAGRERSLESMRGRAQLRFGEDYGEHLKSMGIPEMQNVIDTYAKKLEQIKAVNDNVFASQSQMIDAYNNAVLSNNQAQASYIAAIAAKSKDLVFGLNDSALHIEGGFDAFVGRLSKAAKAAVMGLADEYAQTIQTRKDDVKAKPPVTNFNGGQTFNVKQEFRDQDPDRIALMMKNEFIRAATSRTRARVRTPFGV